MLGYVLSILGLAGLCAAWILFQMWLNKQDPEKPEFETKGCGCHAASHEGKSCKGKSA